MMIAVPIKSEGKVIGIVGGPLQMSTISDQLRGARKGQAGYGYSANRDSSLVTPSRFTDELKAKGQIKQGSEPKVKVDAAAARETLTGRSGAAKYTGYQERRRLSSTGR